VELGLRVLWDGAGDPQPVRRAPCANDATAQSSGRAYLLARLAEERWAQSRRQQAKELAARIHDPLKQLAVESRQQVLLTPRLLLTAAYLVEQERISAFRQKLEGHRSTFNAVRFLCTGPWPAYNFVSTSMTTPSPDEG
jgi:hypothetical protein